jgi:hypothetical protein
MNKHETIYKLYPNVITIRGDVAYDADGNEVVYDENAIIVEMDKVAYIDKRVAEYPSIGDQLDALFHAGVFPQEMAEKIKAVKTKYPKGSA